LQHVGVSGHTQEVRSLAWAEDGSHLLSTGADQTTRLFAEWKRDGKISWHEFSRPQIHGYDLNCIDSLSSNQFISGADEKLLRVFNKPGAIDQLLSKLSGTERSNINGELPEAANIPVLGLSNKAVAPTTDDDTSNLNLVNGDEQEASEQPPVSTKSILDLEHPPLEDHLARHTLWPEHEKLYGHGYEISAVAASHDGSVVATACKASSIDHAVIRLYECKEWREIKPSLTAHSLTVTSLEFSPDDEYLLSVGRDRNLAVFKKDGNSYTRILLKEKAHSRMILDCSWAPAGIGHVFATAGRDKAVKIWRLKDNNADCLLSMTATAAVTAVASDLILIDGLLRLAYGTEDGSIHVVNVKTSSCEVVDDAALDRSVVPSGAVNALRWRPSVKPPAAEQSEALQLSQLAIASDDGSVRILNIGG
jgi:elongator complex protein 2